LRNVVICGREVKRLLPRASAIETVEIAGVPVMCGIIPTRPPVFDRRASVNARRVLIRVKAFSCNYRDLCFIFSTLKNQPNAFYAMGSEFAGEVVATGREVSSLKVGDRVISNNSYTGTGFSIFRGERVREGVATNRASKEFQIFHEAKLMKIPREMPDEVASAFSIGAQTAYSMVRKAALGKGSNILVTAARSNTSLFVVNALRQHQVNLYATTTSKLHEDRLKKMGVREVFRINSDLESFELHPQLNALARDIGGFDCVIDPFFDLHLRRIIDLISAGGRYITCGLCEQYQSLIGQKHDSRLIDLKRILLVALVRNIQLIGNCIGLTEDLSTALQDYASGSFKVSMDSVFEGEQVGEFFSQTYSAADRFGKVSYRYSSSG
jgi:NADPH:quinone reductase-like Zn-dependent oxidoreductase